MKWRGKQRAAKVRQRLTNESRDSIGSAKKRLTEIPPKQQSQNGFIPLNDALNTSQPAVKKRLKPGWRVLSLLLVSLFSYALLTAWQSPEYKVSAVSVSGLQRLNEEEILGVVNVNGMHIFAVEPEIIQEDITAAFPELRDIRVKISLPAQIETQVIERLPMIAWQSDESLIWIDTEGYLIPARGEAGNLLTIRANALPGYHLISSIEETGSTKFVRDKSSFKPNLSALAFFALPKQIDGTLLTAILQLNAWMPEERTLLFQKVHGLGWSDVRGWDVYVGQKLEKINDKMVMYETIVRQLEKEGISPTMVSVEFLHAPYYRTD